MTMIMARVKRTCRAVRRELGKGRGPEMEMGNGRRPRTGRGREGEWEGERDISKIYISHWKPPGVS
jgi:hypothetical protein